MKKEYSKQIGKKHLRVGLEFDGRSVRVNSIWAVDQPLVQLDRFAKDILVRVDVPGHPPFVEALDDPRQIRGVYREKHGHFFHTEDSGIFHISIPYSQRDDLRNVRVYVADIHDLDLGHRNRERMTAVFDDPPKELRRVFKLNTETLRAHPSWGKIRGAPGAAAPEGKFEVYCGKGGEYRWRFVRFPGDKVACSCHGYDSREECLADLQWARNHACDAPVVSTDLLGGADKSGKPPVVDTPSKPREPDEEEEEDES
jgi:uncharacterized protein YegP (UPF0339 family)